MIIYCVQKYRKRVTFHAKLEWNDSQIRTHCNHNNRRHAFDEARIVQQLVMSARERQQRYNTNRFKAKLATLRIIA